MRVSACNTFLSSRAPSGRMGCHASSFRWGKECSGCCGRAGGTMTAVMSAANEKAVEVFLAERIRYLDIVPLVSACCEAHQQVRT